MPENGPLPIKVDFSGHACYRAAWEYLAKPSGGKPLEKLDTMPYQTPNHPAEADIRLVDPQRPGAWRARTRQQGASARATRSIIILSSCTAARQGPTLCARTVF